MTTIFQCLVNILTVSAVICSANAIFKRAFDIGQRVGIVTSSHVDEASGLAASRKHPGYLYTHNDHGHKAHIHILSRDGHRQATLTVSGAGSHDWEDIAVGPCNRHENPAFCIYIADTGNSGHGPAENVIYKIAEPDTLISQTVTVESKLSFSWMEDDCETLLVDPMANVYIVSKSDNGAGVIAHLPDESWGSDSRVEVRSTAVIGIHTAHQDPVAGDISPDGNEVLIKAQDAIYYWDMKGSTDYIGVLQTPGISVRYTKEPQGEAICWDRNGDGFYTLSEGNDQPLFYYRKV